jgi:hypothetical protein
MWSAVAAQPLAVDTTVVVTDIVGRTAHVQGLEAGTRVERKE